jgi:signal transduction histidine kinase
MEAIGRPAGGIAHDFSRGLVLVIACSEMLVEKVHDNAELFPRVTSLTEAVERGGTLTRPLLAFSRQQALEPQVISLAAHLEGVKVDPTQLEQVVINLVVNARDAMPDGGRLTMETSEIGIDDEYCSRNREAHAGRHLMVAVTDTGCGMPPRSCPELSNRSSPPRSKEKARVLASPRSTAS